MWIKERPAAGDISFGVNTFRQLTQFINQLYLDFGVIKSVSSIDNKHIVKLAKSGISRNMKLGFGGILEIQVLVSFSKL